MKEPTRAFLRGLIMLPAIIVLLTGTLFARAQGRPPLIATLGGEIGSYVWASFTPDGKRIAYTRGTNEIVLVDPTSGALSQTIPTGISSISTASFSLDGTQIVAGGYGNTGQVAEIHRLADGSLVASFQSLADTISSVALSPDGTRLAVGGSNFDAGGNLDGTVEIWNVATRKRLSLLTANATSITALTYSRDGKTLAGVGTTPPSSPTPGVVNTWDAGSGDVTASVFLSTLTPNALSYLPGGKFLAVGGTGASSSLLILNATALAQAAAFNTGVGVWSLAVSASGRYVAVGGSTTGLLPGASVVDLNTGRIIPVASTALSVQAVGFSADGSEMAIAGYTVDAQFNQIGVLQIGLTVNGAIVSDLSTNLAVGGALAVSPDGSMLTVGGYNSSFTGVAQLWNTNTGRLIENLATKADGVLSEAFSPNGRTVAVTGYHVSSNNRYFGLVELWSAPGGQLQQTLPTSLSAVYASAFSPDGKLLAVAGSLTPTSTTTTVELWRVSNGKLSSSMNAGALSFSSVAVSPDGSLLAACGYRNAGNGSYPGEVDVWSVASGHAPFTIKSAADQGLNAVAFAPDGKTFATAGGRTAGSATTGIVEIWNAATGARVKSINTGDLGAYAIGYAAVGNALYVGTDQQLKVYSTVTYGLAKSYNQEAEFVRTVAFGPGGTPVAYGRIDGRVLIADDPYAVPYTFQLTSANVTGGGSVVGIITLARPAPPEGITFTLSSDAPLLAKPAASSITLPYGQSRSTITIRTQPPARSTRVKITVSQGTSPISAVLTVGN
jgi:WD40 repeat protein